MKKLNNSISCLYCLRVCFLLCLRYNKLSRHIRELVQKIRDLDEKDGFRAQSTHHLLEKLWVVIECLCDILYPDRIVHLIPLSQHSGLASQNRGEVFFSLWAYLVFSCLIKMAHFQLCRSPWQPTRSLFPFAIINIATTKWPTWKHKWNAYTHCSTHVCVKLYICFKLYIIQAPSLTYLWQSWFILFESAISHWWFGCFFTLGTVSVWRPPNRICPWRRRSQLLHSAGKPPHTHVVL